MARPGLIVGVLAAGAAVLAAASATTAQVSRSVVVTVRTAGGTPVVGAIVCAGSTTDRGAFGGARTNTAGAATLTIPVDATGPLLITGGTETAGSEATLPATLALANLRLPASGGPACPAGTQQAVQAGQIRIPQSSIDRAVAAGSNTLIAPRVGQLNFKSRRCLGAVGQNCNDVPPELGTCDNILTHNCQVNAGSWQHDECCVRNPRGGMCDNNPTEYVTQVLPGGAQVCQAEFNLAVARLGTPFTWVRRIDNTVVNSTGVVDHAAYCAPEGTPVDIGLGESRFCCSRLTRAPRPADLLSFNARALAAVPLARIGICTAP